MLYDEVLYDLQYQVKCIQDNLKKIKNADNLKDEFIISLDLLSQDITCYSENLKAGKDYDADIDFMR